MYRKKIQTHIIIILLKLTFVLITLYNERVINGAFDSTDEKR